MSKNKNSNSLIPFVIVALLIAVVIFIVIITLFPPEGRTEGFKESMIVKASKYNTENAIYMDDVYVIQGNDVVVTEGKILLKTNTNKLRPGMIIIGEEAPGFMRQIDRVYNGNNETIFMTTKVEIERVFSELKVDMDIDPSKMVYERINEKDGSVTYDVPKEEKEGFVFERDVEYPINLANFDSDDIDLITGTIVQGIADQGNTDLVSGAILRVKGAVRISPRFRFKADIGFGSIRDLMVNLTTSMFLNLTPSLSVGAPLQRTMSKRIWPRSNLIRPRIMVPLMVGVWIAVNPSVNATLTANIGAALVFSPNVTIKTKKPSSVSYNFRSKLGQNPVGVKFTNGGWDVNIKGGNVTTPNGVVSASLAAGIEAGLDLLLWGFTGPTLRVNPSYKYEVTYTDTDITGFGSEGGGWATEKGPALTVKAGGRFRGYAIDTELYKKWWK